MSNSDTMPDICHKCQEQITESGCQAMGLPFHFGCFTCIVCAKPLRGEEFWAINGEPYCQTDYLDTLEKCSSCSKPIVERILRATNKPFHPECFRCVVCNKILDDVPFTVSEDQQIHCIDDFNKKYAPQCASCREPIASKRPNEETLRIVAMGKNFHVDCYRCEDCDLKLSTDKESSGCYPLDGHLLCRDCNEKRQLEAAAS